MKHNQGHIAPSKRRGTASTLQVITMFFVAFLAIIIAYVCTSGTIAVGFGEGEKSEEINDMVTPIHQTSFTDETKTDIDVLQKSASRDVSGLYQEIYNEQEAKRKAEEEAARKHELECIDNTNKRKAACGATNDGIDFSIGKTAFVDLWGARIDKYLKGSDLEGYGRKFAECAFEYGMDPRVSPAISNTESTKGAHCFRSHNAWGWMGSASWSDWDTAIDAHVKGLSEGYDYTISLSFAQKYCPPTYQDWYTKTLAELNTI